MPEETTDKPVSLLRRMIADMPVERRVKSLVDIYLGITNKLDNVELAVTSARLTNAIMELLEEKGLVAEWKPEDETPPLPYYEGMAAVNLLLARGYKVTGYSGNHDGEETFIFKTKADAHRAFKEFEQSLTVIRMCGWWYGERRFRAEIEKEDDYCQRPDVTWL